MENWERFISLSGGIIGMIGGIYGIWTSYHSKKTSEKSNAIAQKGIQKSEESIKLTKETLSLKYDTFLAYRGEPYSFVMRNKESDIGKTMSIRKGEHFDNIIAYNATFIVNPMIFSGFAKAIFVCGEPLEKEISIIANQYNEINVRLNRALDDSKLFVIYFGVDDSINIDYFWIFPDKKYMEKHREYMERNKEKMNEIEINSSYFDSPFPSVQTDNNDALWLSILRRIDILKLKEEQIVAEGTFLGKLNSFYLKNPHIEKKENVSNEDFLESAWEYSQKLKVKYSIVH